MPSVQRSRSGESELKGNVKNITERRDYGRGERKKKRRGRKKRRLYYKGMGTLPQPRSLFRDNSALLKSWLLTLLLPFSLPFSLSRSCFLRCSENETIVMQRVHKCLKTNLILSNSARAHKIVSHEKRENKVQQKNK